MTTARGRTAARLELARTRLLPSAARRTRLPHAAVLTRVSSALTAVDHCLKGGTIHLTRHMAAYWAEDGVRVNCLSPGPFPRPDQCVLKPEQMRKVNFGQKRPWLSAPLTSPLSLSHTHFALLTVALSTVGS